MASNNNNNTSNFSIYVYNNNHTTKLPNEPESSLIYVLSLYCVLILIDLTTLIGNLLVVIAVVTTKTLHTVTNSFIMSLAVADMLVAILVMPLSIYMVIYNDWIFGNITCDLWISCDVMLCTASILNLCCISLDRYFAITRPLTYSRQRSPKLAKTMIAVVWIGAVVITCPPVFGWKDKNRPENTCSLNLLLSYRIYSSMGSFFLPCFIMVFVYLRIFKVIHDREKYLKTSSTNSTTFSFLDKPKNKNNKKKCFSFNNKKSRKKESKMMKTMNGNLNEDKKLTKISLKDEVKKNSENRIENCVIKENTPIHQPSNKTDDEEFNMMTILNDENMDDELIKNFPELINETSALANDTNKTTYPNQNENLANSNNEQEMKNNDNLNSSLLKTENTELNLNGVLQIDEVKKENTENNNQNQNTPNNLNNNDNDNNATTTTTTNNNNNNNISNQGFYNCFGKCLNIKNLKLRKNPSSSRPKTMSEMREKFRNQKMNSSLFSTSTSSYSGLSTFSVNQNLHKKSQNQTSFITLSNRQRQSSNITTNSVNNNKNNINRKIFWCQIKSKNCTKNTSNSLNRNFKPKSSPIKITKPNSTVARKLATNMSNYELEEKNNLCLKQSNGQKNEFNDQRKSLATSQSKSKIVGITKNSYNSNNLNVNLRKQGSTNSKTSRNQEQMRLYKESKAAKTLAIVVGGFILSWLPFFIMYVIEAILPRGAIPKALFDWLTWLGYFNSAINPVIYAFCSKQFRLAFYRITFGRFSMNSNKKDQFYYLTQSNFYVNRLSQANFNYNVNNNNNNTNYSIINNNLNRKKISANFRNI